jgi:hypothetical protein
MCRRFTLVKCGIMQEVENLVAHPCWGRAIHDRTFARYETYFGIIKHDELDWFVDPAVSEAALDEGVGAGGCNASVPEGTAMGDRPGRAIGLRR